MLYTIIQPSLPLQAFVKDYLLLHFVFDNNVPVPIKPFPASTLQCLVFYVRGAVTACDPRTGQCKRFPSIALNGSLTTRLDYSISPDCLLLSVGFHPGALSRFLRLPLTAFVDERVDAEAILNPEIHQAQEQMANAPSYEGIVQIAEAYLWKRIQSLHTAFQPIDRVARRIAENKNVLTIEKMAREAFLSISQFERRFMQLTGITPKFFARITRFYNAYQLKDSNPNADWLSIALETGYYDYQHLVKDFKQFANVTLASLLEAQARSPERILNFG